MMNKQLIRVKFGSHLYGTNTPESDTDYKSVHVPNGRQIILQSYPQTISNSTGNDKTKNSKDDIDDESFSILKFMNMIRAGDMVANELLFVSKKQAEFMSSEWLHMVHDQRMRLIDKNIEGFVGYIRRQANKYGIKGSRVATARAATDFFRIYASQFSKLRDIPIGMLQNFVDFNEFVEFVELPYTYDDTRTEKFIEILGRKLSFNLSVREAYYIVKRIFDEYGARALAAEKGEGVDWKSLYHAVRVSEQAIELLTTHNITFPRPNVEYLLKIKRGEFKYQYISEKLEENLQQLEDLMITSDLPEKYDDKFINNLVEQFHVGQVMNHYDDWC